MQEIAALILAGGRVNELSVLTMHRPKSAVPFGGMYRVIDFPLSNLMHSGIERVGILSQYRSISLIRHIGVGASWDMTGRDRNATILPPQKGYSDADWYRGTSDAVYQNLEFLEQPRTSLTLILSGDHIYKMDYQPLIEYHQRMEADLTIGFVEVPIDQAHRFGLGNIEGGKDEPGGRLIDYVEKPERPEYTWASMTVYLFRTDLLAGLVTENARNGNSWEFGRDIIPNLLKDHRVYGYRHAGYWGYTRTVDEYWRCNMDLLGEEPRFDVEEWEVRTNLDDSGLRDRAPAFVRSNSRLDNSLITYGCRVDGEVSHSILFPGCRVAQGAIVRNSILFPETVVHANAVLDRVIADKNVVIGENARVGHGDDFTPNRSVPELLSSGITLIGKNSVIPKEMTIGRNCIVNPNITADDSTVSSLNSGESIE